MGRPKKFCREHVLDKAVPVFWKRGFSDTTVQDLEKATGVNKSGLYAEFKDKDDLYIASLQQFISKSGVLDVLGTEPLGWTNVERFLRLGLDCKGQKGCFITNAVREAAILPAEAKSSILSHLKLVRDILTENLKAAGHEAPGVTADVILTFNTGLALEQNLGVVSGASARVEALLRAFHPKFAPTDE